MKVRPQGLYSISEKLGTALMHPRVGREGLIHSALGGGFLSLWEQSRLFLHGPEIPLSLLTFWCIRWRSRIPESCRSTSLEMPQVAMRLRRSPDNP